MFWKTSEPSLPALGGRGFDHAFNPGLDQNTGLDNLSLNSTGIESSFPQGFSQSGLSASGTNMPNFGPMPQPRMEQPRFESSRHDSQEIIMNKNMEIISSKIDALTATLESINQRLSRIERIAEIEQQKTQERRYSY